MTASAFAPSLNHDAMRGGVDVRAVTGPLRPAGGAGRTGAARAGRRWVRRRCGATGPGGIPRRTAVHWRALARLVEPLDAARASLHHGEDIRLPARRGACGGDPAAACADPAASYWAWTARTGRTLCGASAEPFRRGAAAADRDHGPAVRARVGLSAVRLRRLQRLGTFNRLQLAELVFGAEPSTSRCAEAGTVLEQWGYRSGPRGSTGCAGVFSQALLINRSPRLEDLNTEAFARLHAHPAPTPTTADCSTRCSGRSPRWVTAIRPCAPATTMLPASTAPPRAGRAGCSAGTTPRR